MNTKRHGLALICVLSVSSAFSASAFAAGLGISTTAPTGGLRISAAPAKPSAYPTIGEAKAEFRAALRSSSALRWDHDKRIVRTTLSAGGPLATLGGTFLAVPLMAAGAVPAGLIAGAATATAFLAGGAADSRAVLQARVTTAQNMIKRGMISPATYERWSKAGLFGRPVQPSHNPLAGSLRISPGPSGLEGSLRVSPGPSGLEGSLRVSP